MLTIFMIFSMLAYGAYKQQTNSILSLSFEITPFTTFIICCICVNAFVSYPVQILCAFDIMEQADFFKKGSHTLQRVKSIVARTFVVLCVTGIALIIPNFTDFLNIGGSLGAAMIAFVLPPIMYNKEFKDEVSRGKWWFHLFIVVFGIVGAVLSIVTSIEAIANRS
jgi:amino acid permease